MKAAAVIIAGVIATVGVVAVSVARRRPAVDTEPDENEEDEPVGNVTKTTRLKAIAVGERTDPKVAPLLAELQAMFDAAGITRMSAADMITMSKAPLTDGPDPDTDKTRPVAIPDRALWPGMVEIAGIVQAVVDAELSDVPLRFSGFREGYGSDGKGTGSYNKAVGGAKNSAHIRGNAIDVWLGSKFLATAKASEIKAARERLRMAFARYVVGHPKAPLGFGVYTNDIHIDVDSRRTWARGAEYVANAKKNPVIS